MTISFIITLTFLFCQPDQIGDKADFKIKIVQSRMLSVDTFKIDNKSLTVISRQVDGKVKKYRQQLTKDQISKIEKYLNQTTLTALKADYTRNDFADDHYEFDFEIYFGQMTKSVHIYGTAVPEILKLTEILNSILPTDSQLKYDQAYIKQ